AKGALLQAAADELGLPPGVLSTRDGVMHAPDGRSIAYADLAEKQAATRTRRVKVTLKPASAFTVIGRPHSRIDAHAAVTGGKTFTMDLHVPGALPTMVCRPPTFKG